MDSYTDSPVQQPNTWQGIIAKSSWTIAYQYLNSMCILPIPGGAFALCTTINIYHTRVCNMCKVWYLRWFIQYSRSIRSNKKKSCLYLPGNVYDGNSADLSHYVLFPLISLVLDHVLSGHKYQILVIKAHLRLRGTLKISNNNVYLYAMSKLRSSLLILKDEIQILSNPKRWSLIFIVRSPLSD